jgi:hypothetical protein
MDERNALEDAVKNCQSMLGNERSIVEEMSAGAE